MNKLIRKISIAVTGDGVQVESEGLSGKETEELINRLVKKHKNFMILKKINHVGDHPIYVEWKNMLGVNMIVKEKS